MAYVGADKKAVHSGNEEASDDEVDYDDDDEHAPSCYDKSKSFFDNISCDATEKPYGYCALIVTSYLFIICDADCMVLIKKCFSSHVDPRVAVISATHKFTMQDNRYGANVSCDVPVCSPAFLVLIAPRPG